MPKIIDHDKRKEDILHKAIPLIARDGFHRTNFAVIADACGLQPTALYRYFRDKGELFSYTIDRIFDRIDNSARDASNAGDSGAIARLERAMRKVFETSMEETERMSIVLDLWLQVKREDEANAELLHRRVQRLVDGLERILRLGMERGEIRNDIDPGSMAFTLFSVLESFSIHAALIHTPDVEGILRSVNVLLSGLATTGRNGR